MDLPDQTSHHQQHRPMTCQYCGQEIDFIRNKTTGKTYPVDPVAKKMVIIKKDIGGEVVMAFSPHWLHCSKPDRNSAAPEDLRATPIDYSTNL